MTLSDRDLDAKKAKHIGLIDVSGAIFDSQAAGANNFVKSLDNAYKSSGLQALIIRINSPGGSPVQADYMYNALQYYRKTYPAIKVHAVCVDICASAAYYVAAAADDIYANESSLVGSIGVLYNGFGFVDSLQKLGITRRLQTAGVNKGFLDPFSPVEPAQEQLLQVMLDDIHQQFIAKVKLGRGDRLKVDDQTFSGLFWTGTQAKERGLIDGFASTGQLARDVIRLEKMTDYTYKESMFERVSKSIGTAIADQLPLALGIRPGITS
ncbi:S49 family peptidase [Legionella sp. CNM-4043-24]|uniref:S49 family peptidase n=1 Tax=Legionella sp. CNM-4043-24 TaxID=3421646 RepID=UPI00403B0F2E